ncbi:type II toxin-antitoxin system RelB family antitoxin [Pseudomonas fluorescens]|uniref:type II toxin-antitoxin system RelB family antitoxin n=1 Tax=Pseudomonas fluorescens TaxID=294 RepID=UPI001A9E7C16|nr:antitoxin [Pseudomonas fluorescens]QTD35412.1 antitoxin [Pseudomonas fluorescens]
MDPQISPIVSDFESEEQAASYDRWFRAEVQASIDDSRPNIPHEQVMAEIQALMEELQRKYEALQASNKDCTAAPD